MPALHIYPDLENKFPEHAGREAIEINEFAIGGLAGGMKSGAASVAIIIDLPDGRYVFAQTSLALFLTAADAFKARYGDPRDPLPVPPRNEGSA